MNRESLMRAALGRPRFRMPESFRQNSDEMIALRRQESVMRGDVLALRRENRRIMRCTMADAPRRGVMQGVRWEAIIDRPSFTTAWRFMVTREGHPVAWIQQVADSAATMTPFRAVFTEAHRLLCGTVRVAPEHQIPSASFDIRHSAGVNSGRRANMMIQDDAVEVAPGVHTPEEHEARVRDSGETQAEVYARVMRDHLDLGNEGWNAGIATPQNADTQTPEPMPEAIQVDVTCTHLVLAAGERKVKIPAEYAIPDGNRSVEVRRIRYLNLSWTRQEVAHKISVGMVPHARLLSHQGYTDNESHLWLALSSMRLSDHDLLEAANFLNAVAEARR